MSANRAVNLRWRLWPSCPRTLSGRFRRAAVIPMTNDPKRCATGCGRDFPDAQSTASAVQMPNESFHSKERRSLKLFHAAPRRTSTASKYRFPSSQRLWIFMSSSSLLWLVATIGSPCDAECANERRRSAARRLQFDWPVMCQATGCIFEFFGVCDSYFRVFA